jgi:LacI family transcriptional regulator
MGGAGFGSVHKAQPPVPVFKKTMSNVTIKDIARRLKVSATTVSNALNNKPGVGKAARNRILKLAKEMGYQPNYFAKGLVSRQSYAIGLVITNIADPFYPELAQGVQEQANASGYSMMLFNTNHSIENEKRIIEMLGPKGVDGVVLSTVQQDDPNIDILDDLKIPFVLVNRLILNPKKSYRIDSVTLDNYGGSYQAAAHLCCLGHTKISMIAGDMDSSTAIMRTQGAKDAFAEFGIAIPSQWFVECGYTMKNAYDATRRILSRKDRPTAFLAQDDNMALGVREAAFESGYRIPEDIALVGFNDTSFSSLTGIELTTVHQDQYSMGMASAQMLINKLQHMDRAGMSNNIVMKTELVIRKSCGHHLNRQIKDVREEKG